MQNSLGMGICGLMGKFGEEVVETTWPLVGPVVQTGGTEEEEEEEEDVEGPTELGWPRVLSCT